MRVRLLIVLQAPLHMLSEPFTVFSGVQVSWATCRLAPDVCLVVTCNQQSENVRITIASKRGDSQCDN